MDAAAGERIDTAAVYTTATYWHICRAGSPQDDLVEDRQQRRRPSLRKTKNNAMVSSYKNPTRIARKVDQVVTAWEQIAADAEFAGMTLAAFKTAVAESFTTRERGAELEAELSANLARRAVADANTNERLKLVVNSVKGSPAYGENSDLYRAMGYVTAADKASGLTRKSATPQPEPAS
jgi:hypothetical protein